MCKKHGYKVEPQKNFDGSDDNTTMVVEFPCKVPDYTPIGGNISAIDQLNNIQELQKDWSDNSVSVTIYYRKEELDGIKDWLKKYYTNNVKTISFLLYHGHGFVQAPYETISKEEYYKLINNTIPIRSVNIKEDDITSGLAECDNGSCPIK